MRRSRAVAVVTLLLAAAALVGCAGAQRSERGYAYHGAMHSTPHPADCPVCYADAAPPPQMHVAGETFWHGSWHEGPHPAGCTLCAAPSPTARVIGASSEPAPALGAAGVAVEEDALLYEPAVFCGLYWAPWYCGPRYWWGPEWPYWRGAWYGGGYSGWYGSSGWYGRYGWYGREGWYRPRAGVHVGLGVAVGARARGGGGGGRHR